MSKLLLLPLRGNNILDSAGSTMKPPVVPPWLDNPDRLWSLWDMVELEAGFFGAFSTQLAQIREGCRQAMVNKVGIKLDGFDLPKLLSDGYVMAGEMGMPVTENQSRRLWKYVQGDMHPEKLEGMIDDVLSAIADELRGKKFLYIESEVSRYYTESAPDLFGEDTCERFPSITDELEEAAKCYSLDRPTACVFHLMRSLEVAARALFVSLKIKPQKPFSEMFGWGDYMSELRDYLARSRKGMSQVRLRRLAFYEEAHNDLRAIYKATRCTTLHDLKKIYSTASAKLAMENVKALLSDISRHIDEKGKWQS